MDFGELRVFVRVFGRRFLSSGAFFCWGCLCFFAFFSCFLARGAGGVYRFGLGGCCLMLWILLGSLGGGSGGGAA